ncbi:hypothetical protein CBOM_04340 [Ceraceosorus bombacis]|uniref:OTU domain-containing protein n=1 Tax=Ceraceosorus bombacis TaxID=401625 RepID=A0A0P1BPI8_9BASI|nr:hypothetical protein CBOM_04340 [Ceraceosorus bombacis]
MGAKETDKSVPRLADLPQGQDTVLAHGSNAQMEAFPFLGMLFLCRREHKFVVRGKDATFDILYPSVGGASPSRQTAPLAKHLELPAFMVHACLGMLQRIQWDLLCQERDWALRFEEEATTVELKDLVSAEALASATALGLETTLRDITGDGHCGFRAVALQVLGKQNRWQQVRQDLYQVVAQLEAWKVLAPELLAQPTNTNSAIDLLLWDGDAVEREVSWFQAQLHGALAALAYNAIVVVVDVGEKEAAAHFSPALLEVDMVDEVICLVKIDRHFYCGSLRPGIHAINLPINPFFLTPPKTWERVKRRDPGAAIMLGLLEEERNSP